MTETRPRRRMPADAALEGSSERAGDRVVLDVETRTVVKVLALVLAFEIAVSLMETIRTVLVWSGTALFLAIALNPAVTIVERFMRRTAAVVAVFTGFAAALLVTIALLVQPFVTQVDDIVAATPHAAARIDQNPLVHRLDQRFDLVDKVKSHASELPTVMFGVAGSVLGGVTAVVTILFLTAFILFELPRMSDVILAQLRPAGAARAREIGAHINRTVGGYVAGNLLISVIAGTVATTTLWLLGVPYALTLGVVVAIGDLVPLVGATIASAIVIATAYFAQGTAAGIVMLAVILVYQQVENHLIQPIVYRRTIHMPSVLVLIAVLAGASLLGILGALFAIPIAGTIHVVAKDMLDARAARIARESGAAPAPLP